MVLYSRLSRARGKCRVPASRRNCPRRVWRGRTPLSPLNSLATKSEEKPPVTHHRYPRPLLAVGRWLLVLVLKTPLSTCLVPRTPSPGQIRYQTCLGCVGVFRLAHPTCIRAVTHLDEPPSDPSPATPAQFSIEYSRVESLFPTKEKKKRRQLRTASCLGRLASLLLATRHSATVSKSASSPCCCGGGSHICDRRSFAFPFFFFFSLPVAQRRRLYKASWRPNASQIPQRLFVSSSSISSSSSESCRFLTRSPRD